MKSNSTNVSPSQKNIEDYNPLGLEENNEDIENDLYLLALHKRLHQIKKDRKKAEQDALLLKNRLNLLKGEEDKVKILNNLL